MKKSIKDVFEIAGHKIDFSAVGYSLKDLPRKLSSLLRGKTLGQIETIVYDALRENWTGIVSGSKEFVCYQEQDGRLCPCHVEAGRSIPYPCVFILNCNLSMAAGRYIHLRIKIDKTGQTYNSNLYGVTYEYKVSELFICDEEGNSLLGFSQMPFPMDLKSLFLSLSRACGKESLTKEDEGKVAKNVYESWIKHGMLKDSEQPLIKDTARHLTFETGLQTKDGRNVQIILWKDAATDIRYEFRVVMGMSSILDQNEEDKSDSRLMPAKPMMPLPVPREITICGAVVVKELAIKLGVRPNRLIADLMMLKVRVSINQRIEPEVAIKVAQKYGYKVKVEHARDATNKKPVLEPINAGDEILQDNPTYSFGVNVGGAIVAARQASKNEQHQTEAVNMPTDTTQKNTSGTKVWLPAESTASTETEVEFLKRFREAVSKCGFHYEPQDLIRFHTCVKCGFLTVLGGSPGSGKSSLVKLYARAVLGKSAVNSTIKAAIKDKCGILTVDVNSSWIEPEDVLGHWDLNNKYREETKTGIVSFLRNAVNATHLNMICLEEMNLARVEHYFSNFMQLSERKDTERYLAGVPLNGVREDNDVREDARLPVNESVRIVGTNNFDETTQRFSDRFYDRCSYIELQDCPWDVFVSQRPDVDRAEFNLTVPWELYKSWIKTEVGKDDLKKIKDTIGGKYKAICEALKGLNLMPSPRVGSLLINYIANRPSLIEEVEEKKGNEKKDNGGENGVKLVKGDCKMIALDEFIAQRILPRYTPSYLKDGRTVLAEIEVLEKALKDMPLSEKILENKKAGLEGKPST